MPSQNPFLSQLSVVQNRERHRENAARFGTQYYTYFTEGTGELVPENFLLFQNPFVRRPYLGIGSEIVALPDLTVYKMPQATAGVLRWEQRPGGFFIGAYMYFIVEADLVDGVTNPGEAKLPAVLHHLTFTGLAYKQMSDDVNDGALDDTLIPLQPPMIDTTLYVPTEPTDPGGGTY
jgi:hypothetical protein